MQKLRDTLMEKVTAWDSIAMLAKTHGQSASPTRLGKEMMVFVERIDNELENMKSVKHRAKFGGATGGMNVRCAFSTESYTRGRRWAHACSLEARMCVINGSFLGRSLPLTGCTFYAVTTLKAHAVAYPGIDWRAFATKFLSGSLGLVREQYTTQLQHYDSMAAIFHSMARCAFFGRNIHSRIPLDPTPARLKRTCV
jgi:adenylosuccinate lyase